ncbi:YopX family protein [Enterococcus dongliensis]|uniref:YopX family protein n=1 Tax=Enterococcus dongliensis TaxID=2559925 RepID=A0AAW8TG59_9ENTE|nr:YopX family protein [Enterococcus dongliensis]MDT2635093.1 YopX family protein [Enterococcus dongliensis]MDT2636225.1 YopX family protein [Enterococcus dongliensis]MDT2643036.1 YopX family protein [Enterococcus dongliensis]
MIPRFRAWYTPFKGKTIGQEMKYGQAGSLLTHAEMSPDDYKIMQSTSFHDTKGTEIFVGDIVIHTQKSINYGDVYHHSYAEVFQQKNGAYRIRGKHIYGTDAYGARKKLEVVGNIYENAELLDKDSFMTEV